MIYLGGHGFLWVDRNTASFERQFISCEQIIEGAITVVFGIIAWFLLPGFPDQNTFLTQEETALILQRVEQDRGDSLPDVLTKEKVIRYLLDWKIWAISTYYLPLGSLVACLLANLYVKV